MKAPICIACRKAHGSRKCPRRKRQRQPTFYQRYLEYQRFILEQRKAG